MHETDAPKMCWEGLVPRRSLGWLALALPPMLLALPGAASWAAREAPAVAGPLAVAAAALPDASKWGPVVAVHSWWRGGR
jgi:hypothetical protein